MRALVFAGPWTVATLATLVGASACGGAPAAAGGAGSGGGSAGGEAGGGGEGGQVELASYRSGARLRAQLLEGKESVLGDDVAPSRVLEGMFDLELGTRCSFARDDEGALRCLPDGYALAFADAGCTEPFAYADACADVGPYVLERTPVDGTCPLEVRARVHELGADVTPPALAYQRSLDGACRALTLPPAIVARALGPLVAPSSFVGATLVEEPVGELTLVRALGDDGSSLLVSARDAAGERCEPMVLSGVGRCVPAPLAQGSAGRAGSLYAEEDCLVPVVTSTETSASCAPPLALLEQVDECQVTRGLVTVGASIAPTELTTHVGDVCDYADPDLVLGAASPFVAGTPVPSASLPALDVLELGAEDARFRARRLALSGRAVAPERDLVDKVLGATCAAGELVAGDLRCIARGAPVFFLDRAQYGDPSCTFPVFVGDPCEPPPTIVVRESAESCDLVGLWKVGVAVTVPTLFGRDAEGVCVDLGVPPPEGAYFFGEEILLDELGPLVRFVE